MHSWLSYLSHTRQCVKINDKLSDTEFPRTVTTFLVSFVFFLFFMVLCPSSLVSVGNVLMYTKQLLSQLTLPDFNQLQRNSTSSAISERTLEECWTTLQRVSWILFNRVEYSSSTKNEKTDPLFFHVTAQRCTVACAKKRALCCRYETVNCRGPCDNCGIP